MIKDLAWSHSTTLKLFHIYAAYRTCELFYHSQAWDRLFYSIVSCIQFQHRIIVHPVPASYRVSSYSIALLCIQFQQRIEIQFQRYSTCTTFLMWLPGRGVNNLPVWITFLGWTTWPNHQRLTWVDFLHGWPNAHVSQCEWITLTLHDGITLVT